MPWLETTEERDRWDQLQQPFEVLREMPNAQTSRVRTLTNAHQDTVSQQRELDALGMPSLAENEPSNARLQRLDAFHRIWNHMDRKMKEVLEKSSSQTFLEIGAFIQESHPKGSDTARQRIVPTALAVAGSINAADNADTFPSLTDFLRSQGCYSALLGSRELGSSGSVASALCSILRQFSGLQTDADDVQALMQWYEDEICTDIKSEELEADASQITSPLGKMALQTPAKAPPQHEEAVSNAVSNEDVVGNAVSNEDDASSPMNKLSLNTPQLQKLRPRVAAKAEPAPPTDKQETRKAKEANTGRPLVVIVESTESADPAILEDFILLLSENRCQVPLTLVLGLATSAGVLAQLLPSAVSDVLDTRNFHLVKALAKLEAIFKHVFLAPDMPVLLSHALLRRLDDHFMLNDFTVRTFQQSLKLACLSHFQTTPLSELAALSSWRPQGGDPFESEQEGGHEQGEDPQSTASLLQVYPKQMVRDLCEQAALPQRPMSIQTALQTVQQKLTDWKVALLWVNAAAKSTGHQALTDGFSLRELYRDAAKPKFFARSEGKGLLFSLQKGVSSLSQHACTALLETLESLASGQSISEELQCLVTAFQDLRSEQTEIIRPQISVENEDIGASDVTTEDQENQDLNEDHNGVDEKESRTKVPARSSRNALGRRNALTQMLQASDVGRNRQTTTRSTPGESLWEVFEGIQDFADAPPTALPGSRIFHLGDKDNTRSKTTFAPRHAIDKALYSPEAYLGGQELGLNPHQLDITIAYHLLTELGEDIDVGEWFSSFCMLYQTSPAEATEESPPKKARRGRAKGSRKIIQEPAQAGSKTSGKAKRPGKQIIQEHARQSDQNTNKEPVTFSVPVDELISRFTQATNELQLMGIVKAVPKKRASSSAQRLVFGSGQTHPGAPLAA